MAHIKVDSITKTFGYLKALDQVSLEVHDREFLVLLGPTGAGKTTTLRCVAGLEKIDSGAVYMDGDDVTKVAPSDRDVAFVFQNYALYPRKTVAENIAFPLLARSMSQSEIEAKINEVTKLLSINHLLDRFPAQLSGGEQQRVALSRALVRQPKVYCMDEPLTNLDFKLRTLMRSELKRIQQDMQATFFYVTNDQIEALSMGDRIVVLNEGEVQQVGPPQAVYENPANLFVAGFIGSTRMNFLKCVFDPLDNRFKGQANSWSLPVQNGRTEALAQHSARESLILGVRPEDLALSTAEGEGIRGEVYVAEPLGDRIIYDVKIGDGDIIKIKTRPTERYEMGEVVTVQVNVERSHVFDEASELAIR